MRRLRVPTARTRSQLLLAGALLAMLAAFVFIHTASRAGAAADAATVTALGWVGDMTPAGGTTTTIDAGDGLTVTLQVWKAGVTDQVGQGGNIACTLHWGQVDTFGGPWYNITDTPMTYQDDVGNNDRYTVALTPGAGRYEFTGNCQDLTDGGVLWQQSGNGMLVVDGGGTPTPTPTPGPTPTPCVDCPTPTPTPAPDRTVIVQLFEWRWDDIALECENFLGPKGFAAVQVSPPMEHRLIDAGEQGSNPAFPWWQRYQPVSYKLDSRSGTRAEFVDMVSRCNEVGVAVYVDAVINHMAGLPAGQCDTGSAGTTICMGSQPGVTTYPTDPGRYDPANFNWFSSTHPCQSEIVNWDDPYESRACELLGLDDLDQSQVAVRNEIVAFLDDLTTIGVTGFRVDAAKHMWPNELDAIFAAASGAPYVYQEVIQSQLTDGSDYTFIGDVTEFRYGTEMKNKFRNNTDIANLNFDWMLPGDSALVFIDNHDTQRGDAMYYQANGDVYILASVYMLAHPYGTARLMSSYHFTDGEEGPPTNGNGTTRPVYDAFGNPSGCQPGEWVCEHRLTPLANMVAFRNVTDGQPLTDAWDNGFDQVAFGRGDRGYVVVNRSGNTLSRTFATSMAAGDYCDVVRGELTADGQACTGPVVTVDESGQFTASVPGIAALAIHAGQRVGAVSACSGDRYVSLDQAGTVDGVAYTPGDVLAHDAVNGWCVALAGAAHGLGSADIDAVARYQDDYLLSFAAAVDGLPGIAPATVAPHDVVLFDPASGVYAMVLDGSDVGLTTADENVDAVALDGGTLLVSTTGAVAVAGVTGDGRDLLACGAPSFGDSSACTWSLYFDGSDAGAPPSAGIDGATAGVDLLLTLDGPLLIFDSGDVLRCASPATGPDSGCGAGSGLYWRPSADGLSGNVNALHIVFPP